MDGKILVRISSEGVTRQSALKPTLWSWGDRAARIDVCPVVFSRPRVEFGSSLVAIIAGCLKVDLRAFY